MAADQDGARLDQLVAHQAHVSRRIARQWIAQGLVAVNRRVLRILAREISAGATIVVAEASRPILAPTPASQPRVRILYLDKAMVAIAKPAGLLSERDRFGSPSLESVVPAMLAAAGERADLWLVHRLDAGTSGVMIMARTAPAARRFNEAFREGGANKIYWALCRGKAPAQHVVDAPIARAQGVRHMVSEAGKPACTHLRRLAATASASWVEALPQTGRTHQIRVHLAHVGHPILGDRLYGGPGYTEDSAAHAIPRPMLHAHQLTIAHPKDGHPMVLQAEAPQDFQELARHLQLADASPPSSSK